MIIPPAPECLHSRREQQLWAEVIASRPREFFDAANRMMLAEWCAHTHSFEVLTEAVTFELASEGDADLGRLDKLNGMRSRESRAAAMLAGRLRLSNSSRHSPEVARSEALRADRQAGVRKLTGAKPWEDPAPRVRKRKVVNEPETPDAA